MEDKRRYKRYDVLNVPATFGKHPVYIEDMSGGGALLHVIRMNDAAESLGRIAQFRVGAVCLPARVVSIRSNTKIAVEFLQAEA